MNSIAQMAAVPHFDEAAALRARMDNLPGGESKAAFARRIALPGGASMLSQHCSGTRPISFDAAVCYAKGFGVSLREISPRIANQVSAAMADMPAGGERLASAAPALADALEALGASLAAAPAERREALAMTLAGWAREGGRDHWRSALMALLENSSGGKQWSAA